MCKTLCSVLVLTIPSEFTEYARYELSGVKCNSTVLPAGNYTMYVGLGWGMRVQPCALLGSINKALFKPHQGPIKAVS